MTWRACATAQERPLHRLDGGRHPPHAAVRRNLRLPRGRQGTATAHALRDRRDVCARGASAQNKSGKLRLVYECNPISFIIEQAGGKSTTGTRRMLDVTPTALHQVRAATAAVVAVRAFGLAVVGLLRRAQRARLTARPCVFLPACSVSPCGAAPSRTSRRWRSSTASMAPRRLSVRGAVRPSTGIAMVLTRRFRVCSQGQAVNT
jgi:hypothetical protein